LVVCRVWGCEFRGSDLKHNSRYPLRSFSPFSSAPPPPLQVNKLDLLVWLAAFFGVLFIGVEIGLAISIGLALMLVMYQSAFPHTAVLGKVTNSVYRWVAGGMVGHRC
jgi:hypothetical protein